MSMIYFWDTGLFPSFQSKERRTELPLEHKTLHKDDCKVFQSWLMRQNIDKVDEKCFVFSVIASRTPSLFSPEGERETKIQQVCQNTPNGRYHAPDFSFTSAKLRLNIIINITSSFVNVFIAFNHLYSSVIRTCRGKNVGFVPNAKPQIVKANPKLSKCERKHRCRMHHRETLRRP